ncbi:MAG: GntR family transcriptional regulator [Devosia sp.]|nr:GntR family transcriptional regulator [Devosia sp.]
MSDVAYRRVLEALFDRRLPAGAFVSQNDLVKLLGVPVAPLRDALRVLEAEGILTIHPRSGIQITKPGAELTKSTYQLRTIIERAAVKVFCETATDEEIANLRRRHLEMALKLETAGITPEILVELEYLEELLHNSTIEALRNPLAQNAYDRMRTYLRLVRLNRRMTVPLAQRTMREHIEIIAAIEERDPNAAEAALVAHFTTALQRHLGMFI